MTGMAWVPALLVSWRKTSNPSTLDSFRSNKISFGGRVRRAATEGPAPEHKVQSFFSVVHQFDPVPQVSPWRACSVSRMLSGSPSTTNISTSSLSIISPSYMKRDGFSRPFLSDLPNLK